ncbi:phage portal protein [Auritidibacter ignavus]|uniref:phage portal protein n=1 Tax=Auritidibacter ignavus TaxID=678932 RepID=UPI000F01B3C6|nr:phage portal protein [Auritidibacter ignavus]NIH70496.1 A118 family predicted phage portal protein [Auritidibacter ignavus]RMX23315.1 phage portal protein [Auritidibacter ignavus]
MPLPETSIPWPPKQHEPAYQAMRVHDAWYTGNTDALSSEYAGTLRPRNRPLQYAGGMIGAVSRMFWGKPAPAGETRTRLHVPVPADLATISADLLFSEAPRILLDEDAPEHMKTRVDQVANTPTMHSTLLEAAEVAAALCGVYLRAVWDTSFTDHVMVDVVHPDRAYPEFRWGVLTAVTFWTVLEDTDTRVVYRHLERHEPGVILHGLYKGDHSHLGQQVPLVDHPDTAWLADVVDSESGIPTGETTLTATYIPNMMPSRVWRTSHQLAPLGRSDYEGVEPLFDALDETYSSWMRDIRLAKARLIVPNSMLETRGPGRGTVFDADREIYDGMDFLGSMQQTPTIEAHQFGIRHEEHRSTALELVRAILRSAGYSPSTFGDDPMAVSTTATEVKARENMSKRTRAKKTRYWSSRLGPFIQTVLNIDATIYGGERYDTPPQVKFQETIQQDQHELAQTAKDLRVAEVASTDTMVRMLHPNWDRDAVNDEVQKIVAERATDYPIVDPGTLYRADN